VTTSRRSRGAWVLLLAPWSLALAAHAESVPVGRYVALTPGGGSAHPHAMTSVDVRRTGRFGAVAPARRPAMLWSRTLEQRRLVPPAVLADGSLLLAGSLGVTRLGPTGELHWTAPVGRVHFTPVVLRDRSAVVTTVAGDLLLVDAAGGVRTLATGRRLTGLPLALSDDLVAVTSADGALHLIDVDGSPRKVLPTAQPGAGRSALVAEGLVALSGSTGLSLLSLHQGRERTVALAQQVATVPVVGEGGMTWLVGREGLVWGITQGGMVRFEHVVGEAWTRSQPALGADGALRMGTGAGALVCLGPDGSERWRRGVDGRIGAISLDAEDTALFVTSRSSLYAIDRAGDLRWRLDLGERGVGRPVLGSDGTVYLVAAGGRIHAWR